MTTAVQETCEVISPIDGSVLEAVTMNTTEDLNKAVEAAQKAFESWSALTLRDRSKVLYKYRELLLENIEELSKLVQQENGKIYSEARAEIEKAAEVTEFACALPQLGTDKILEVSRGIHCRLSREPLGVVASITPFNFPSMVPHWTIPIALGLGNAMILKPSEKVPLSAFRTAENVAASMSGCAGQRCMAASVMVAVGDVDHIVEGVVNSAKTVVPGDSLGAVISKEAKERIERYITQAEEQGATILLDSRNTVVPGKENGFYVGATVIDNVTPDMDIAKDEVFGPVLSIIRVKTVEDAIALQNTSNYGNGASVFTQSGPLATYISEKLKAGMIGINIGVPVPREPFSFWCG